MKSIGKVVFIATLPLLLFSCHELDLAEALGFYPDGKPETKSNDETDRMSFRKYLGNPVLSRGDYPEWDWKRISNPDVFFKDGVFNLWYSGTVSPTGSEYRIGLATSTDRLAWTKYSGNPVLSQGDPGSWNDFNVIGSTVLITDDTYHMWFAGYDDTIYRIGHATSMDGINWTEDPSNPVLNLGGVDTWDDDRVIYPDVVYKDGVYHMWYEGSDGGTSRIGHATSANGTDWTKDPGNPVLDLGMPGSWDDTDVLTPNVMHKDGKFRMWYSGSNGEIYRIGYATSSDGTVWEKYSHNPVMNISNTGWDSYRVHSPDVTFQDGTYHMYYAGCYNTTNIFNIGYAVYTPGN